MNTITDIQKWPDGAVVEAVTGRVAKSYDYKNITTKYGEKTVQNAEFQDAGGNKIRLTVWEHPDLKALEGKEVVLHSSRGRDGKPKGVSVKLGSYKDKPTFELSVGKDGQFQIVEVYAQQNPNVAVVPPGAPNAVKSDSSQCCGASSKTIHGATVGAAINNACANLTARGEDLDPKKVYVIASELVKVALHMESGNLYAPKSAEKKTEPVADKPTEPAQATPLDEDVPY